ncbi:MAG: hypothetical protein ACJ708_01770 [Nitrososphaeraceae archaeon]|jgi:hypothetical protein
MTVQQENSSSTTIDVTLKLPDRLCKVAQAISVLLGYDAFEDYLCELIRVDVKSEIESAGQLEMMVAEDVRERILAEIE